MEISKILRYLGYLGCAISIVLLIVDTVSDALPYPVLIAVLWISAIIEIIGMILQRRHKK